MGALIVPAPGLYIHVPFCPQICPYCAFAKVVDRPSEHQRYADAICRELEERTARGPVGASAFGSIFIGGGTPSLLEPSLVEQVLETADRCQGIAADAEITIEANPGTADVARFGSLRRIGVNRLSIGVQGFDDSSLAALGRIHDGADAGAAFSAGRSAGFDNISVDLIFGVPGAAANTWRENVERAIELGPEHLSCYALTIEEGTVFAARRREGRLTLASEEEEVGTLLWTDSRLGAAGYEHYEVSNYALPGRRSRHNWGYWVGMEYLGIGVSAHSFCGGRRSWNHPSLDRYLASVEAGEIPVAGDEHIDAATRRCERIWLGLRTRPGVVLSTEERDVLGASPRLEQLRESGFLEFDGDRLYATAIGFPLVDGLGVEVTVILELATQRKLAIPGVLPDHPRYEGEAA